MLLILPTSPLWLISSDEDSLPQNMEISQETGRHRVQRTRNTTRQRSKKDLQGASEEGTTPWKYTWEQRDSNSGMVTVVVSTLSTITPSLSPGEMLKDVVKQNKQTNKKQERDRNSKAGEKQ